MSSLTATQPVLDLLRQATGLTEIRDANGTVIGFFAPVSLDRAPLYAQAAAQIDPTESRRRKDAGGKTYTTAEVLDHLKSLESVDGTLIA